MGFRSYVRHFRGAIWGFSVLHCHGVFLSGDQQQQQQKPLQRQEEKVAKIHSSRKKKKLLKSSFSMGFRSYVRPLGIFGVQFWGFSVLHCHGVFLSGDQQQQQQQKLLQRQEEKVAKIHSSSKKKKPQKSSFSMGFRSYVRHFRNAILGLLRPSLPWCFPIRGPAAAAAAAKASAGAGGKGSQNS